MLAGPFLAAHLCCWVWAFQYTDLPSAVLLLVLQPLFAAWMGSRIFREKITPSAVGAVGLAVVGLLIITFDDLTISSRHLVGDALAAAASLFMVIFMALGRKLRPHLSLPAYMTLTYGGAGLWSLLMALIVGAPFVGYPASSYMWLLGLIVITTGIGHAAFNYVLPHVRLFTVNIATVAEPALSILAAVLFLGQKLTPLELAGGTFLMAALFVGVRDERKGSPQRQVPQVVLD
jgi:drug/metabolite transporter (DMT)-like permease